MQILIMPRQEYIVYKILNGVVLYLNLVLANHETKISEANQDEFHEVLIPLSNQSL